LQDVEGRELPDFAAEFDATTWPQFFLKYIVSHPAVTVAIPGTRRPESVPDNFGAALGRLPDAALRRRQEEFFDSLS
jgi:aryl-alcohol dehydrogenase-like predicted oxidoreductase